VVVSVLVLGGVGYGIYAIVKGGSKGLPSGWKEYTFTKDKFKAAFPESPEVRDMSQLGTRLPAGLTGTAYMAKTKDGSGGVIVMAMQLPVSITPRQKDEMIGAIRQSLVRGATRNNNIQLSQPKQITWAGQKAEEALMEEPGGKGRAVIRYMLTETGVYAAMLGSDDGQLDRDVENAFFNNFQLLK
jgi:hypothetical protein